MVSELHGESASGEREAALLEAADLMKLMGNPNRLAILCRLSEGEASVGEMEETLGIRQPTLSQQLGELRKAGLIADRRAAKVVFYRLADTRALVVVKHVHAVFCNRPTAPLGAAEEMLERMPTGDGARADVHAAVFGRIVAETERARLFT